MNNMSVVKLISPVLLLSMGLISCSPPGDEMRVSAPAVLTDIEKTLLELNDKSFQNAEGRFFTIKADRSKNVHLDMLEVASAGDQVVRYDIQMWPDGSGGIYNYKRADYPNDLEKGRVQVVNSHEFLLNDFDGGFPEFMDTRRRIRVEADLLTVKAEFFMQGNWHVAIEEENYPLTSTDNMPELQVEIPDF